ncbi:hypothetical protein [uncultured Ruminococcus sp.]|jgi:hypothetical protein|uniref:hypothetical protein n=1 Tax=uncultured Ruminococcus sp. TaxID=165186 RepID=UPI001569769D|nr:hypothetical protein [uncultured Ruminococcus sp.]
MGGRGSSSGVSDKGKKYGTEYSSVYESGNIKFLVINSGNPTAPMETMTKGRVYVTLGSNGNPKFISYYDKHNKRFKQIDIDGPAHTINGKKELPHTHRGYEHDEKGTRVPSSKEKKLIERVKRIWAYHTGLN